VADYMAVLCDPHQVIDLLIESGKVSGPALNLLKSFNALARTAGTDEAEYHADRLVEAARELAADPDEAIQ